MSSTPHIPMCTSAAYAEPCAASVRIFYSNRAFDLERAACAVFGLATFGVHMTGTRSAVSTCWFYEVPRGLYMFGIRLAVVIAYEGESEEMKIWVPKRSATKPT
jgi:hypothetical protein